MNKQERAAMKKAYQQAQRESFLRSLPLPMEQLEALLDHLDERLGEQECKHDLSITAEFLAHSGCDVDAVLHWLTENGGGCDCEVLCNIEEKLE